MNWSALCITFCMTELTVQLCLYFRQIKVEVGYLAANLPVERKHLLTNPLHPAPQIRRGEAELGGLTAMPASGGVCIGCKHVTRSQSCLSRTAPVWSGAPTDPNTLN